MEAVYDAVIVGGGPAGLTAALYLARARRRVVVLERGEVGGQIAITQEVVNYPGVAKTGGRELTGVMRAQAERFGAKLLAARATALDCSEEIKTVRTDRGDLRCHAILLACGARPRTVGFRGEEEYRGRGVAYCATCDGELFTGRDVFVVGGGYAAAEESVFLTRYARHVTILMRKGDFSCAASVAEHARSHEKITILPHTEVEEVSGGSGLTYLRYKNNVTGEVTEHRAAPGEFFGLFVLAGYEPESELARGLAELDEQGYVLTDPSGATATAGLYAAGDLRAKPLRQLVTATADGALAATAIERATAALHRSPAEEPEQEELFSGEVREQLDPLLARLEQPLVLRLTLDERPVSREAERFARALAARSGKLSVEIGQRGGEEAPCIAIFREDGTDTGLAFHGVPGGHEFTSFVLGLYNAAGPGQPLPPELPARIARLAPARLQILVTLSCSMCPPLVTAAQQLAAHNPGITAHVYDIAHFPALRERYQVLSVPCLVLNGERAMFGRRSMEELVGEMEKMNNE